MRTLTSEQQQSDKRSVSRRRALQAIVASAFAACVPSGLANAPEDDIDALLTESLDALAQRQNEDGSFGARTELFGRDPATAALCGLAFLASGSLPGRGRYGGEIGKIVDFLLSKALRPRGQTPDEAFRNLDDASRLATLRYLEENDLEPEDVDGLIADFSGKGRKPTYGHGFATLFLAEISGMIDRAEIRETTKAAIDFIVRTQNTSGGWRYEPKQVAVGDLSVTTCMLSALRSAHNAGIHVPQETIVGAESFILSLQNPDGGFRYMSLGGPSGYGRTASAIHALQAGGNDKSNEIEKAFNYLNKAYPLSETGSDQKKENVEYWSYAQFYAALSYWRSAVDTETQKRERLFFKRLKQDALARRDSDGTWRSSYSTEAETAFVICALSVPRERTPLFIR